MGWDGMGREGKGRGCDQTGGVWPGTLTPRASIPESTFFLLHPTSPLQFSYLRYFTFFSIPSSSLLSSCLPCPALPPSIFLLSLPASHLPLVPPPSPQKYSLYDLKPVFWLYLPRVNISLNKAFSFPLHRNLLQKTWKVLKGRTTLLQHLWCAGLCVQCFSTVPPISFSACVADTLRAPFYFIIYLFIYPDSIFISWELLMGFAMTRLYPSFSLAAPTYWDQRQSPLMQRNNV